MISLFLVIFRLLHHLKKYFVKKKYEAVEKRNNPIDSKLFKD